MKLTVLAVRGDDHVAVEFPLQLVQFATCIPTAKLGAKPLQAELPLLEPLAQVEPRRFLSIQDYIRQKPVSPDPRMLQYIYLL